MDPLNLEQLNELIGDTRCLYGNIPNFKWGKFLNSQDGFLFSELPSRDNKPLRVNITNLETGKSLTFYKIVGVKGTLFPLPSLRNERVRIALNQD